MSYIINIQKIANELEFEIEDVKMLIGVFLDSAKENLEKIESAIEQNDYETIFKSAHSIKGSSANFTLDDISQLAKEMEVNARNQQEIDYHEMYCELKKMIDSIVT
jgi:HPt (histidine-containing phosphotransfer) domain-containing protein